MSVAELERSPAVRERESPVGESRPTMSVRTERAVVLGACLAIYLAVGAVLVYGYDSIAPDALSRVGNASYVLFSRDPKLAAIGFVWTPLPSLIMLPVLPLKFIWPSLLRVGFTANIESAV